MIGFNDDEQTARLEAAPCTTNLTQTLSGPTSSINNIHLKNYIHGTVGSADRMLSQLSFDTIAKFRKYNSVEFLSLG
jgi:hypothetical protein